MVSDGKTTMETKMELHFVNREYTSFELGFYVVYLVLTVVFLLVPKVGFYARLRSSAQWTFEQAWCLALLAGLALLFQNPLYALELGAGSKAASLSLSAIFLYGVFLFLAAGLCYALLFTKLLAEPVRERRRFALPFVVFAALLSMLIGVTGATLNLYGRLEGAGEPGSPRPV